jgi:eukaryotic-like serine/threonine-protein kinase
VVGSPFPRAEYDANRGNFRGVARSIASGMPMADLEKLRTAHLATHPGAAGSAHVRLVASKAYEQRQEWAKAVEETENALTIDPLNVALHQRYAQLVRKLREAGKTP